MILQSLKMAWKSIASNKMRSFLTMLGIIIGVFALVVLVSLVNGTTASVTDSISSLGSNLLSVTVSDDKGNPLKLSDLDKIAENPAIDQVAPLTQESMTITASDKEETATVYGTTASYFTIRNLTQSHGRLLKSVDQDNHSNAIVLSSATAEELLGGTDVVGEAVKLDGTKFNVVGVLADDDDSTSSITGVNYEVYVPYSTLIRIGTSASSDIANFYVSATDTTSMDAAESALMTILMERFEQDDDAFKIVDRSSMMDVMNTVTTTLSMLLGGIAAISLLVGGIGIMNIMLVSVTERTREIGIRKAIGASRGTIMLQFLIEAFVISLLGCLIGIGLSWIAVELVDWFCAVSYTLDGRVIAISIAFSLLMGVLFGLYPANKAAKKKPIEALRYGG